MYVEFVLTILHIAGQSNVVANILSKPGAGNFSSAFSAAAGRLFCYLKSAYHHPFSFLVAAGGFNSPGRGSGWLCRLPADHSFFFTVCVCCGVAGRHHLGGFLLAVAAHLEQAAPNFASFPASFVDGGGGGGGL